MQGKQQVQKEKRMEEIENTKKIQRKLQVEKIEDFQEKKFRS